MTNEELAAIKARADSATPGPWEVGEAGGPKGTDEYYIRTKDKYYNDVAIASEVFDPIHEMISRANAVFIAHARQDIPALVAEVERLQAQLHEAENVIKVVDEIISNEALYDAAEGDCNFCGAEAYEDGYHHEPGCFADRLETALQLYKARVSDDRR